MTLTMLINLSQYVDDFIQREEIFDSSLPSTYFDCYTPGQQIYLEHPEGCIFVIKKNTKINRRMVLTL